MMISIGMIIVAAAILFAWLYNCLVRSRNRVDTAWSDIAVQLQRRHDLIPNIVKAVNTYASYERATIEAVTELRSQAVNLTESSSAELSELEKAQTKLASGVLQLLAIAESYPELQADQNFLILQKELIEAENLLQFARRYYNASVRDFNTLIETVPNNLVAQWCNFTAREFFQKSSDQVAIAPTIKIGS